jgi:hypothetical protein
MMTTKEKKMKGLPTPPLTPEQRSDKRQLKLMKYRAAYLSIKPLSPTSCLVWGGEKEHIVQWVDGLLVCDCLGWATARHHNCSHITKYRLVYGDLKKGNK